jgi:hypothetical protein
MSFVKTAVVALEDYRTTGRVPGPISSNNPSGTFYLTKWLTGNQVVKPEKYMLFEDGQHCTPSQYCAPLVERLRTDRNPGAVSLFFSFANQVVS